MIAINHALTGGLVAISISNPALALPAALLSHFAIDALPHWNYQVPGGHKLRPIAIGVDMMASAIALTFFATFLDVDFWIFILGGLLGILPDAMWLPFILHNKQSPKDKNTPLHILRRFHAWIQWSESSKGIILEGLWFVLIVMLVIKATL